MTWVQKDVKLWLDDVRPAPEGWTWVKNVEQAKLVTWLHNVTEMSLDHDLGVCEECSEGLSVEQWLEKYQYKSMPNCSHFGTGYTFICWLEERRKWPLKKPTVHSANPVGANRMRLVIDKFYDENGNYDGSLYRV